MPSPIRVLLADDHDIVRAGLKAAIRTHDDFEVVGEAEDGRQVLNSPLLDACDAVLMVKYVVRRAAKKMGLTATFMPKPLYGEAGSGMHCHQLVFDGASFAVEPQAGVVGGVGHRLDR